jgi:hypothetical protein
VLSPQQLNGIRPHGGVRQNGNLMKVPFAYGAETMCVYLEPTQVYNAQGKPNKSPHNDIGKRSNKQSCQ